MNPPQPARVEFQLCPALWLAAVMVIIPAAASAVVVWFAGWPLGGGMALLLILLGWMVARDRALLKGSRAPRSLEIRDAGLGLLRLRNGESVPARAAGAFVSRWMVVLRTDSPTRRHLLVAHDMLPRSELRVLRLWALWGKLEPLARLPGRPADDVRPTRTISNS